MTIVQTPGHTHNGSATHALATHTFSTVTCSNQTTTCNRLKSYQWWWWWACITSTPLPVCTLIIEETNSSTGSNHTNNFKTITIPLIAASFSLIKRYASNLSLIKKPKSRNVRWEKLDMEDWSNQTTKSIRSMFSHLVCWIAVAERWISQWFVLS
jgi:hypothetical protein